MAHKNHLFRVLVLLMCSMLVSCANMNSSGKETIIVYPGKVIREGLKSPIGINLNYLRDSNANYKGARTIQEALKDMGARHIRYPGGEKSDWLLWDDTANRFHIPHIFGFYEMQALGYEILGFDEYMTYVREVGGTAHIVVGYDSFERTGITRERYLKNAVEWVKYANMEKKYNIRYWEIGNENWNNNTGSASELAEIVSLFSRKMKKIDPSIKIGASGNSDEWWSNFLPKAANDIDFLTVSQYSCTGWGGYDYYVKNPEVNLIEQAETALNAIAKYAPERKDSLKVVIAELNSADFGENAWNMENSLAHALVTFEIIGQMLKNSGIEYGMVWNTRWMETSTPSELWYALGTENELLPPGRALSIWGRYLKDQLVDISRTDRVVTFCSKDSSSGDLSVFLLNKSYEEIDISLEIRDGQYENCDMYCLAGNGPDDKTPVWIGPNKLRFYKNKSEELKLPGVSLTVLNLSSEMCERNAG